MSLNPKLTPRQTVAHTTFAIVAMGIGLMYFFADSSEPSKAQTQTVQVQPTVPVKHDDTVLRLSKDQSNCLTMEIAYEATFSRIGSYNPVKTCNIPNDKIIDALVTLISATGPDGPSIWEKENCEELPSHLIRRLRCNVDGINYRVAVP
jgi:hypothetical protein